MLRGRWELDIRGYANNFCVFFSSWVAIWDDKNKTIIRENWFPMLRGFDYEIL